MFFPCEILPSCVSVTQISDLRLWQQKISKADIPCETMNAKEIQIEGILYEEGCI